MQCRGKYAFRFVANSCQDIGGSFGVFCDILGDEDNLVSTRNMPNI